MKAQIAVLLLSLTIIGTFAVNMECLICSVTSPRSCTTTLACQENEVCSNQIHVVDNTVVYKYGCMERVHCMDYIKHERDQIESGKKREHFNVMICSSCCIGNLCNRENCYELRRSEYEVGIDRTPSMKGRTYDSVDKKNSQRYT